MNQYAHTDGTKAVLLYFLYHIIPSQRIKEAKFCFKVSVRASWST